MALSDNSNHSEGGFAEPQMSLAQATDALRFLADGDHAVSAIMAYYPEVAQAVMSYLLNVGVLEDTKQKPPKMLQFNGKPSQIESRSSRLQPIKIKSIHGDTVVIRVENGEPVGAFRLHESSTEPGQDHPIDPPTDR